MSTEPANAETPNEDRLENTQSESATKNQSTPGPDTEEQLDEQVEDSFPASDAPANY